MTRAEEIIRTVDAAVRARGGRQHGAETRFQCPETARHAHGDADPSADWNPAKAVWACRACGARGGALDLARRLGLDTRDRGGETTHREMIYELRDAAGVVVAQHVRNERNGRKSFAWRRGGRWGLHGLAVADLPLFGAEDLAAIPGPVVLVEGEKARDALAVRGLLATASVTGASGTPSDATLSVLVGRDVVLWPDADAVGRPHLRRVAARLAALGVRARWYDPAPDATDGRDAADCSLDTEALLAQLAAAPPVAEDGAVGVLLADVAPEPVAWLWTGRLARGKLTLLEGRPDEGKSTLALDLAARVTTGAPMPGESDRRPAAGVVVVSAEDGLADTLVPRLHAAGADLGRVLAPRPEEVVALDPDGLGWLRRACARVAAALVVLDPLVALMPGAVDAHRDQDVRRMLRPLRALAEDRGVAVLAIRHLRKALAASPKDAGGGSVGLGAAARVVMLAAPDPDDPEGRKVLARVKGNLAAPWPSLAFRLAPAGSTVRVEWLGETTHTADALLAQPVEGEERGAIEEAREALATVLAVGPVPAREVDRERQRLGISEWAWRRARRALRVRVEKTGFHEGWTWALPRPSSSTPSTPSGADMGEKAAPIVEDDGPAEDDGRPGSRRGERPASVVEDDGPAEDDGPRTKTHETAEVAPEPLPAETLRAIARLSAAERQRFTEEYSAGDEAALYIAQAVVEFGAETTIVACAQCGGTRWRRVGDGEVCIACHPDPAIGGRA